MDEEEVERVDHDSYYAVLNVPRDASEEDIKRSYRNLAQACHPDKVSDPAAREQAATSFMRIQEAYEVLGDEERRTIYDVYGMEGLKAGMEVGEHLRDPSELKREFEKFKAKQAKERQEASVAHRGVYIFKVDACDLMNPYDEGVDHMPELTSVATTNSVQIPVSETFAASVGCQVGVKKKEGGGSFVCGLKRILTPHDTLDMHGVIGLKNFAQAELSRQLSAHTSARVAASWQHHAGLGLSVGCGRQLSPVTNADWMWQVGPASMMSLGFSRRGTRWLLSCRLEAGASTGVVAKAVWQVTASLSLRASAKFGTMGMELEVGGAQQVTEFSSAGCAVAAGTQGIVMKPRFGRGGHVFEVPILLSPDVRDYRMLLVAYVAPPLLGFVTKYYIVRPLRRRAHIQKILKRRTEHIQELEAARRAAIGASTAILPVAKRKLRKEVENGGLVVVSAKYGTPEAIREAELQERLGQQNGQVTGAESAAESSERRRRSPGEEGEMEEAGDDAAAIESAVDSAAPAMPPGWLDVTTAVRFMVGDSNLQFHKGLSKSGLLGFCDAAPEEEKVLQINYLWRSRPHSMTLADKAGASLPRDGTPLSLDSREGRHILELAEAEELQRLQQ